MGSKSSLAPLQTCARVAIAVGGAGSLAFMLRAGRQTPGFLLVIFVFWVLAPFAALAWGSATSEHWSALTRTTLEVATIVLAAGSLAIYGGLIPPPAGSPHAFVFVATPPATCLLLAIALAIAALVSRRRAAR